MIFKSHENGADGQHSEPHGGHPHTTHRPVQEFEGEGQTFTHSPLQRPDRPVPGSPMFLPPPAPHTLHRRSPQHFEESHDSSNQARRGSQGSHIAPHDARSQLTESRTRNFGADVVDQFTFPDLDPGQAKFSVHGRDTPPLDISYHDPDLPQPNRGRIHSVGSSGPSSHHPGHSSDPLTDR